MARPAQFSWIVCSKHRSAHVETTLLTGHANSVATFSVESECNKRVIITERPKSIAHTLACR